MSKTSRRIYLIGDLLQDGGGKGLRNNNLMSKILSLSFIYFGLPEIKFNQNFLFSTKKLPSSFQLCVKDFNVLSSKCGRSFID